MKELKLLEPGKKKVQTVAPLLASMTPPHPTREIQTDQAPTTTMFALRLSFGIYDELRIGYAAADNQGTHQTRGGYQVIPSHPPGGPSE